MDITHDEIAVVTLPPSRISVVLHETLTSLVDWYDKHLVGQRPSLIELSVVMEKLRGCQPLPSGGLGSDIRLLLKPNPAGDPRRSIEALERIRAFLVGSDPLPVPGQLNL